MADTETPQARVELADERATGELAERLAAISGPGDVIALWGDLGAGKTAFARSFIRARLGGQEEVPSPTFTLVQTYGPDEAPIAHFDFYRLSSPDEVFELGFDEALDTGTVLIEWPDRLGPDLPADRLDLYLDTIPGSERRSARLYGRGYWSARISEVFLEGAIHG